MKTAIRFDDITPEMDYDKFNRVKTILDEAGIKALVGVVPYCKDDTLRISGECDEQRFVSFLAKLRKEGWSFALHGYNHLYTTRNKGLFPINEFSEFAGVEYDKQNVMIRQGISQLAEWGIVPELFMAPGHTFDKNTLRALKDNKIDKLTDGFGEKPYIRDGITFFPISKKRSECISDKDGYNTYVLHTNGMTDSEIDKLAKLIADNRENFISYDELLKVEPCKRGIWGNVKEYCLALAKHILVSRRASKGTVIHDKAE